MVLTNLTMAPKTHQPPCLGEKSSAIKNQQVATSTIATHEAMPNTTESHSPMIVELPYTHGNQHHGFKTVGEQVCRCSWGDQHRHH